MCALIGCRWGLQGCEALVCMPETTPEIKVKAVKRLGGTVELVGESYTETQAYAQVWTHHLWIAASLHHVIGSCLSASMRSRSRFCYTLQSRSLACRDSIG